MNPKEKYAQALQSIPAPGNGCHPLLLSVANYGISAGCADDQIFSDIRKHIPSGTRDIPDREIYNAISKARGDRDQSYRGGGSRKRNTILKPEDAAKFIGYGHGVTEGDILKASPQRIFNNSEYIEALLLLCAFYDDAEYLFIGDRYNTDVKTVKEWKELIANGKKVPWPHIIPNPLTGSSHTTKSGKTSYRCDASVKSFRIAIAEFDNLSREDQFAFWAGIPLRICALIDSGGKSIHAWIKVHGIQSPNDWEEVIENGLYAQRLVPLGVDPQCKNESRLSRLPGCFREGTGKWQKLLYLNPNPDETPIVDRIRQTRL